MKNGINYALSYLFFTFLTYMWRLSVFSVAMNKNVDSNIEGMASAAIWVLLINYVILVLIAYYRGKAIDKKYIIIFPIIAGLFDVILVFIPLVPTIMNITALITGVSENKVVYVVKQEEKNKTDE